LHKLGIAHRDIKPQNILINGKFEVKLIDFNISKKGKDSENSSKFTKRFMTQVSSPLFAAPEIYSPDCYSESVDIWGLGIVFITMIFGMKIFSGKNIQS
jgi:serine/threonine protein kinase